jgi:hypothetical protein
MPITTLLIQHQIEIPQQSRHDESHLVIRQIPTNTVSRSKAEGLVDLSFVIVEWR